MEPRLKSDIWVKAFIRRCWAMDVPAMLRRRGEESSGAIFLKLSDGPEAVTVYARGSLLDGRWGWRRATGPAPVNDAAAEAYLERQLKYDSDLWIVEVESGEIERFVDDPVGD